MKVTVTIPATTANLGPGFDCLGLALALYNQVSLEVVDQPGLTITTSGEGADHLPTDTSNLVYQAVASLLALRGQEPPAMHLHLQNHIPISSGLGSSAAAVVGGLLAANALLAEPVPFAALQKMAIVFEGHPDNVVAALHGGLILAVQDADCWVIEPIPLPPMQVIIVLPDFAFPTAEARAVLPPQVPRGDAIFNHSRLPLLLRALETADYAKMAVAMQDRLHQPYRLPLVPGLAEAFAAARAAGAAGVAISGAGPSLVAFAPDYHDVIAKAAQTAFSAAGLSSRAWVLPVALPGATQI